ncbi:nucleotidyltransferase family protein [Phyllobacterium endophyticum]|jgi:N-acetyl-alpha-D-muramate 1-phosphate uridylyltransferase|uniref:nucleotidyltransferase family protein n=1 Tax=Phyllobacterium endophyticum TaxID=1149773 RepID=UPI0011CC4F0C|nr:nucleotidyltransferase family protein [Phyllobacterium endophyticum]TXR50211.1 nucleotidyltransferase family protein [Phyllobacterium endophyticum]
MAGPNTAMVLAAGLGKRMAPITDTIPKPLVRVAGKPLLDWGLDALVAAGVERAIVNVHYLADQLDAHLAGREAPTILISDERKELLDSAGGIVNALANIGPEPFFIINADTFWVDGARPNLVLLAEGWDDARMDILLMIATKDQATGYDGRGDFQMGDDGQLRRLGGGETSPYIYAGAAIVHPRIFAGAKAGKSSLNRYFDAAIAENRLYGLRMEGLWLTVGTPEAIGAAEAAIARQMVNG